MHMFSVRFRIPSAGAEGIHPVRRPGEKTGEKKSWIVSCSSTTASQLRRKWAKKASGS